VMGIMKKYAVPESLYYEFKYKVIGKMISLRCRVIGRFMSFYFAGRLESENVCQYFRIMQCFHSLGVHNHDRILYDLGMKEKEHEVYFLNNIKNNKLLPLFERIFSWGKNKSANNVDLDRKYSLSEAYRYCRWLRENIEYRRNIWMSDLMMSDFGLRFM
jgi:hypothetical protein